MTEELGLLGRRRFIGGGLIKISVLDVGHGSCAVLHGDGAPSIVDGGVGKTLLEFLYDDPPDEIDTIVISHADQDHISGLRLALRSRLLRDIPIGTVFVNPAQAKTSQVWARLVVHLEKRQLRHGTDILPLKAGDRWTVGDSGRCELEVLSPPYVKTLANTNDNNMSGVVRIHVDDEPEILLPADVDSAALNALLERGDDLNAAIAVFPHHGGAAGDGNAQDFARRLMEAVQPAVTMLSLGRRRFQNPNPSVMQGIALAGVPTHIGCTQLSSRCCSEVPATTRSELVHPSAGSRFNESCTGTVTFEYESPHRWSSSPDLSGHAAFVEQFPGRLCAPTAVTTRPNANL